MIENVVKFFVFVNLGVYWIIIIIFGMKNSFGVFFF